MGPSATVITVGTVFPLEGRPRAVSEASLEGIELALALAREDGVEWADRVRLVGASATTAEAARSAAERLIDDGAAVLQGSAVSAIGLAASEVSERRGRFFWEVAAIANEVTERGHRGTFRLNANARDFARAALELVGGPLTASVGTIARLAVVYESTPFGRSVGMTLVGAARSAGYAEALDAPFPMAPDAAPDLRDILVRVAAQRPDVLLATTGTREAATLVRSARDLPSVRAVVGVGGGWANPILPGLIGAQLDGVLSVNNSRALTIRAGGLREEARALHGRYAEVCRARGVGEPQADRDLNFIGTSLLVRELLPAAPDADRAGLRAAALAIDVPSRGCVNGMGVRFDETGHNTRGSVVTMQWHGGALRTVHPSELATHAIMRAKERT